VTTIFRAYACTIASSRARRLLKFVSYMPSLLESPVDKTFSSRSLYHILNYIPFRLSIQSTPFKRDGGSNVESVIVKGSVPVSGFEVVMTIARTRENFLGIFIAHKRAYH
jgi:hypothetical protein